MKRVIITIAFILIVIGMLFYFRTASQTEATIDKKIESMANSTTETAQQLLSGSITSSSFNTGSTIPKEYTCDGQDSSPELSWHFNTLNTISSTNTPSTTDTSDTPNTTDIANITATNIAAPISNDTIIKSYVLIVDDPDAQPVVGHTVIHWALLLPPSINQLPAHVSGKDQATITEFNKDIKPLNNSYETAYYQGPCPPATGEVHTYNFTIFALKTSVEETYRLIQNKTFTAKNFKDTMDTHIVASALLQGTYSRQ